MTETSEFFYVHVLHYSKEQLNTLGHTQLMAVYPPDDFKPYLNEIAQKCKGNHTAILAELTHQSDKYLSTFTDMSYKTPTEKNRTIPIETHIFIFNRDKGDDGKYKFIPKKSLGDFL